jgi:hypothetical protein
MYRNARETSNSGRIQAGNWNFGSLAFFVLSLLICCLLSNAWAGSTDSTSSAVVAAAPNATQVAPGGGHPHRVQRRTLKQSPDVRVDRIGKQFNLNDAQRLALKKLLEDQQSENLRLWNDQKIDPFERMNRLKTLREHTNTEFVRILDVEQKRKYDELAQQRSRANTSQQPTVDKSAQPQSKPEPEKGKQDQ